MSAKLWFFVNLVGATANIPGAMDGHVLNVMALFLVTIITIFFGVLAIQEMEA